MFIALLFSLMTFAADDCTGGNYIASSRVQDAIDWAQKGVVPKSQPVLTKCGPKDPCICYWGIAWEAAKWDGKNLTNDPALLAAFDKKVAQDKANSMKRDDDFKNLKEKVKSGTASQEEKDSFLKALAEKL